MPRSSLVSLTVALAFALVAPAWAGPGHGHGGHGHGHDHGPAGGKSHADDPRAPLFGQWRVDVEETIATDPAMRKAAEQDPGLEAARRAFAGTSLSFGPEGAALVSHPEGRRRGLFTAEIKDGKVDLLLFDAHQNQLEKSTYTGTIEGDRMVLTQGDTTVVLRRARPGGQSERKSIDRARAKAIVGDWRVDVEATLAADTRLKTLTAEQQKAVRDGARKFLSGARFGWQADGGATITMGDEVRKRTWRLLEQSGNRHVIEVTGNGPTETLTLETAGDQLRMMMGPRALILVRP